MAGERRTTTIGRRPAETIEIEELDPGLEETRCLLCGRLLALCKCSPEERAQAMKDAEALAAARPYFDRLTAWWRDWRRSPSGAQ